MFTVYIPLPLMNSFVPSRGSTRKEWSDPKGSPPEEPSSETIGHSGLNRDNASMMTS